MRTIFVSLTHARSRAHTQHQEISFKRNKSANFHINDHADLYFVFHTLAYKLSSFEIVWKEKRYS